MRNGPALSRLARARGPRPRRHHARVRGRPYPRLAARYAFEHCADHLPGAGAKQEPTSAHFGKEHGLLSLSLYAPQLEHAARWPRRWTSRVRWSSSRQGVPRRRRRHGIAIVGALGLGVGKTSNAAPAFVERRTELMKAVEARLIIRASELRPRRRRQQPDARAARDWLEHDAAWLPEREVQRAWQGGAPAAARRPRARCGAVAAGPLLRTVRGADRWRVPSVHRQRARAAYLLRKPRNVQGEGKPPPTNKNLPLILHTSAPRPQTPLQVPSKLADVKILEIALQA